MCNCYYVMRLTHYDVGGVQLEIRYDVDYDASDK